MAPVDTSLPSILTTYELFGYMISVYTCVSWSDSALMSSLMSKFAGLASPLLARMTCTRLVAWPQMSGPNMIA